jgi:hypothetical protein
VQHAVVGRPVRMHAAALLPLTPGLSGHHTSAIGISYTAV